MTESQIIVYWSFGLTIVVTAKEVLSFTAFEFTAKNVAEDYGGS